MRVINGNISTTELFVLKINTGEHQGYYLQSISKIPPLPNINNDFCNSLKFALMFTTYEQAIAIQYFIEEVNKVSDCTKPATEIVRIKRKEKQ